MTPADLTEAGRTFLAERHLATLTTLRADGTPHVVPVGFSWDGALARVIAGGGSAKARHPGRAALCQVDGARWLTLEGELTVSGNPAEVADAVARYAARYRPPRENPERVVLQIAVDRVLGSASLLDRAQH